MITHRYFGTTESGLNIYAHTVTNVCGTSLTVIDYGASIQSLYVMGNDGGFSDVVCGYDSVKGYENGGGHLGAVPGRFANRIANGRFTLDGVEYVLPQNNGVNCLHGGTVGFSHRVWNCSHNDDNELYFSLISEDGDQGFPGKLAVTVTYRLDDENRVTINYKAITDKKTIVNLTNHSYFNLGGCASGKIFDQRLWLDADSYLATDAGLIPTGGLVPVEGTAFDFNTAKPIGRDFFADNVDLKIAGGYDHCFNFTHGETDEPVLRGCVYDEKTGRIMELYTNKPCVQFYTANFLNNADYPLKNGCPQETQTAFCLETQFMPDSINHENFTDCVLEPGEVYDYTTVFAFSVKQ